MLNAKDREGRELEEAPPSAEQGGGKVVDVIEEIEEDEEVDAGSDMGRDITFLWLRSSGVCLSRRESSLVKLLILGVSAHNQV